MKYRSNRTWLVKVITLFVALMVSEFLEAQTTLTLQQAIDSVLKRDPSVQAASLQIVQSRQLQKSSVSIPNPEVLAESPTGEFYTIGVTQSFDFPGTYVRQNQYQKEQTKLAGFGKAISSLEVKFQVARIYLNAQYQFSLAQLLSRQDSLYKSISDAADKLFNSGKLDIVQKTFSNLQYGEVHLKSQAAKADYETMLQQLALLTGISSSFQVEKLQPNLKKEKPNIDLAANPYLAYSLQQQIVSRRLWQVERNRALPGFAVGYLNQGPMSTPIGFRFRAGITVPIWFWQYSGRMNAAKTGIRVSEFQGRAQQQQLSLQLISAQSSMSKAINALLFYEDTGLKQAETIEMAAQKLFGAGETDYTTYLRTLNDSYSIRFNHLEAVKNYNEASLELNFLSGKL
jgi:outer membrane protein, heavy metal efflux system